MAKNERKIKSADILVNRHNGNIIKYRCLIDNNGYPLHKMVVRWVKKTNELETDVFDYMPVCLLDYRLANNEEKEFFLTLLNTNNFVH